MRVGFQDRCNNRSSATVGAAQMVLATTLLAPISLFCRVSDRDLRQDFVRYLDIGVDVSSKDRLSMAGHA